jgi:cation:H+ antiporter
MLSRAAAAHALSATMTMLLAATASILILSRTGVSLWGVGVGSATVLAVYLLGVRVVYYDQRVAQERARSEGLLDEPLSRGDRRRALRRAALTFAIAAAAILASAPFLAEAAGEIAEVSGLGGTFVGTTLVALSTSLPELVATIAAVRMGAYDLALGNIFGSNAFNLAMLLPVDIASRGPLLSSISPTHAVTAVWIVIITAVALIGQLYQVERRRRIIEPDAVMVIALVLFALWTIFRLG